MNPFDVRRLEAPQFQQADVDINRQKLAAAASNRNAQLRLERLRATEAIQASRKTNGLLRQYQAPPPSTARTVSTLVSGNQMATERVLAAQRTRQTEWKAKPTLVSDFFQAQSARNPRVSWLSFVQEQKSQMVAPESLTTIQAPAAPNCWTLPIDVKYFEFWKAQAARLDVVSAYKWSLRRQRKWRLVAVGAFGAGAVSLLGTCVVPAMAFELLSYLLQTSESVFGLSKETREAILTACFGPADPVTHERTGARLKAVSFCLNTIRFGLPLLTSGPLLMISQTLSSDYLVHSSIIQWLQPGLGIVGAQVASLGIKQVADQWKQYELHYKSPELLAYEVLQKQVLAQQEKTREWTELKLAIQKAGNLWEWQHQKQLQLEQTLREQARQLSRWGKFMKWTGQALQYAKSHWISIVLITALATTLTAVLLVLLPLVIQYAINMNASVYWSLAAFGIQSQLWPLFSKAAMAHLSTWTRWLITRMIRMFGWEEWAKRVGQRNLLNNPVVRKIQDAFEWYYRRELYWECSLQFAIEWLFQSTLVTSSNLFAANYITGNQLERLYSSVTHVPRVMQRLTASVRSAIELNQPFSEISVSYLLKEWLKTEVPMAGNVLLQPGQGDRVVKQVDFSRSVIELDNGKQIPFSELAGWRVRDPEGDAVAVDVDGLAFESLLQLAEVDESDLQTRHIDLERLLRQDPVKRDQILQQTTEFQVYWNEIEQARATQTTIASQFEQTKFQLQIQEAAQTHRRELVDRFFLGPEQDNLTWQAKLQLAQPFLSASNWDPTHSYEMYVREVELKAGTRNEFIEQTLLNRVTRTLEQQVTQEQTRIDKIQASLDEWQHGRAKADQEIQELENDWQERLDEFLESLADKDEEQEEKGEAPVPASVTNLTPLAMTTVLPGTTKVAAAAVAAAPISTPPPAPIPKPKATLAQQVARPAAIRKELQLQSLAQQQSIARSSSSLQTTMATMTTTTTTTVALSEPAPMIQTQTQTMDMQQTLQLVRDLELNMQQMSAWAMGTKDFALVQQLASFSMWLSQFGLGGSTAAESLQVPFSVDMLAGLKSKLADFRKDQKTILEQLESLGAMQLEKCFTGVYSYDLVTGKVSPPEYEGCYVDSASKVLYDTLAGLGQIGTSSVLGSIAKRLTQGWFGGFAISMLVQGGLAFVLEGIPLMKPLALAQIADENKKDIRERNIVPYMVRVLSEIACSTKKTAFSWSVAQLSCRQTSNRFNVSNLIFKLGKASLSHPDIQQVLGKALTGSLGLAELATLQSFMGGGGEKTPATQPVAEPAAEPAPEWFFQPYVRLGAGAINSVTKISKVTLDLLSHDDLLASAVFGDVQSSHARLAYEDVRAIAQAQSLDSAALVRIGLQVVQTFSAGAVQGALQFPYRESAEAAARGARGLATSIGSTIQQVLF